MRYAGPASILVALGAAACGGSSGPGPTPMMTKMPEGGPTYAGGACPTFVAGENVLVSGGVERRFLLQVPLRPEGAPVVFTWHWWTGQPDQAVSWTGLGALAGDADLFVVSPFTHPDLGAQWDTTQDPAVNVDVRFFDDILACLTSQWSVDRDRIWASGHSMGALFTSQLALARSEWLAGFLAMSGGLTGAYRRPVAALPAILVWGGPSDTFGAFSFADASLSLSEELREDGSFVVQCEGDFGHQLPPQPDELWRLLIAHIRGEASPYAGGQGLPGWCAAPS